MYDASGNITEGATYAYTLGELGEVTASDSYVYPAKDANPSYNQLLSLSGQSIVYDACGNPTTYRRKALSWEGRRLANDEEFWAGFADGAADGALWGGISALGGAAIRTAKLMKNGVAIGENMSRVTKLAKAGHQVTYHGMPGFNLVKRVAGENLPDLFRCATTKHLLKE